MTSAACLAVAPSQDDLADPAAGRNGDCPWPGWPGPLPHC